MKNPNQKWTHKRAKQAWVQSLSAALGLLFGLVVFVLAYRLWPHPPLSEMFPRSSAILAADHSLLRLTTAADEQFRYWQALEHISPLMIDAMLMQEDRWFYQHPGVNPLSLARATVATYSGGNRQGGSTLTMQLARLLDRKSTSTVWAKIKQIFNALHLELSYSKHDILEAYLNYAPFGGNVQGVGAASYLYFSKSAAQLSPTEAAFLAVIPQQPTRRPFDHADTLAASKRLVQRWLQHRPEYRAQLADHLLDTPVQSRAQRPFKAPHFTDQLLSFGAGETVVSSLEPALQKLLERQLRIGHRSLKQKGVSNASAILVDWRDAKVKALVGSLDYFDASTSGQVNGTMGKRSPGSTLKPLLYGLALDQGLIHPLSMLKDAPSAFGAYTPENYDGGFAGPISAQQALVRSRNIPAVGLAMKLDPQQDLYQLLRDAGVSQLRSREHYGLALVLGAGEVTMQELASLYLALANQGEHRPLSFLQTDKKPISKRLLSPEASYLVLDMLAHNLRPSSVKGAKAHPWFTAWKTGTSWSFRDAWTAGVVGPYVLVVWTGNFSGEPNPALIGVEAAAPLWWSLADALPSVAPTQDRYAGATAFHRSMPANVSKVDICAESGELPNPYCPLTVQSWFIPGVSPIAVSRLHRPVMINKLTGRLACPPYDKNDTEEIFAFWPSDLAELFAKAGLPRRKPPSGQCDASMPIIESGAPEMLSPYTATTYVLKQNSDEKLPLQASVSADVTRIYWFEKQRLLGTTTPGKIFYWRPERAGLYELSVIDDKGRASSREVAIEMRD